MDGLEEVEGVGCASGDKGAAYDLAQLVVHHTDIVLDGKDGDDAVLVEDPSELCGRRKVVETVVVIFHVTVKVALEVWQLSDSCKLY